MIDLSLNTEEAMLVEDSLRDIISCTIGAIHDGDPDDRPRLEREIGVLRDIVAGLKEQRNRSVQTETV